jgi:hypothetical protein
VGATGIEEEEEEEEDGQLKDIFQNVKTEVF